MAKAKAGFEVRNRPDWLYNALPYFYVVLGLIVIAGFGMKNAIGELSGVVLISAGATVFAMRRMSRRELAKFRVELALKEQRKTADESTLLRISWNKAYESGNLDIDEQHHQLFDMGNAILNAILSHKPTSEIVDFLDLLLKHIQKHLVTEEIVLYEMGHPISSEHKAYHEQLAACVKDLVRKGELGTLEFGEVSEFITYDLIAQHIIAEDKQYFVPHPK